MSNWSKRRKKKHIQEFDLAKFIAEDRCVICGASKSLDNLPKDEDDYPIISTAKDYFFIVCPECRKRIHSGLCVSCGKELLQGNFNDDYVVLDVVQHLSEEIIRLRSELTRWIPEIQQRKKDSRFAKKNVKRLFKKK